MRRDFTVNCIYYFSAKFGTFKTPKIPAKLCNDEVLAYKLTKYGFVYIANENLFILQSHEIIHKLFSDGTFQKDELSYVTNQLTEHTVVATKKTKAKQSALRIIIDPSK